MVRPFLRFSLALAFSLIAFEGRGLMKRFNNASEMARDARMDVKVVEEAFQRYNEAARAKKDEFGRQCDPH